MLSRLIRHTVIYVAELHVIFGRNSCAKDEEMCERIRVEFDMFVMRAANYIYRSRCLGTWQYLAILPFGELSADTVWRLYFFLVAGGPEAIIDDMDMSESNINNYETGKTRFGFTRFQRALHCN